MSHDEDKAPEQPGDAETQPVTSPVNEKEAKDNQGSEPSNDEKKGKSKSKSKSKSKKDKSSPKSPKKSPKGGKPTLFDEGRHVAANFGVRTLDVFRLKSGKVFVLSPSHFLLVAPGKAKEPILYPWKNLSRFDIPKGKNVINISFTVTKKEKSPQDKTEFKLEFKKDQFQNISSQVIDLLQRVLTDTELNKLFFSRFKAPAVWRTTKAAQARFRMNIQGDDALLPETKDAMYDFIQQGIPDADLSDFKDSSALVPIFFDVIPFIETIRSVRVPQINDVNVYELAAKLLKEESTLRALEINGKNSKNGLAHLIDAIKKNHKSKIRGLSFGLSKLSVEDLDTISDLIAHCEVRTIGFHDAFRKDTVPYFYSSFLSPKVTSNLYCLNLERTHNVDLERLFPKISKVRFLSLANCDLDIVDVMKKLSLITSSRLRELNLSGNRITFDHVLEPQDQLPQYLLSLILNDITWPEDSFNLFFYQIFRHIPDKLKLSLSNSNMEKNEWLKAFEFFDDPEKGGCYNGLSVLVWDQNPLHEKLFRFLKHNPNITRLQLNSCFMDNPAETDAIDSLQDYLASAAHLRTLIIRGNEEYFLGANTARIVEAIKHIPNLEQLDIMDSRGGNDAIQPIQELCQAHPQLKINFDGLRPTKWRVINELLTNLVLQGDDKERITYPTHDINRLIRDEAVTERDARHFQDQFYYSPGKTVLPKVPKDTQFTRIKDCELAKPSNLYRLNADDNFPTYVSEELIQQFRRDNQPLSLTGDPEETAYNNADDEVFYSMVYASRRFSQRIPEMHSGIFNKKTDSEDEDVFRKKQDQQYASQRFSPKKDSLKLDKVQQRDVEIEQESSSSSSEDEPRTPRKFPESKKLKPSTFDDEIQSPVVKKSPKATPGKIEEPNFELPQLVDLKHYDYPQWKTFDKEFTLQKMYTEITTVKRSVALSTISPSKK